MKLIKIIVFFIIICNIKPVSLYAKDTGTFLKRFDNVKVVDDIQKNNFKIVQEQKFVIEFENLGETQFIPTIDKENGFVVIFFANSTDKIMYKSYKLTANVQDKGELNKIDKKILATAFRDLNNDGLKDIIIIIDYTNINDSKKHNFICDVLFATNKPNDNSFYIDNRITNDINTYKMNNTISVVTSFVRDGKSSKFLYTSKTLDELIKNGFSIIENKKYEVYFKKFGKMKIVSGFYEIGGYNTFMVYLIDTNGEIVWSFKPTPDYANFSYLKDIVFRDIDGDGLKDIVILARYDLIDEKNKVVFENKFSIYYQRAGYFIENFNTNNEVLNFTIN